MHYVTVRGRFTYYEVSIILQLGGVKLTLMNVFVLQVGAVSLTVWYMLCTYYSYGPSNSRIALILRYVQYYSFLGNLTLILRQMWYTSFITSQWFEMKNGNYSDVRLLFIVISVPVRFPPAQPVVLNILILPWPNSIRQRH